MGKQYSPPNFMHHNFCFLSLCGRIPFPFVRGRPDFALIRFVTDNSESRWSRAPGAGAWIIVGDEERAISPEGDDQSPRTPTPSTIMLQRWKGADNYACTRITVCKSNPGREIGNTRPSRRNGVGFKSAVDVYCAAISQRNFVMVHRRSLSALWVRNRAADAAGSFILSLTP